MASGGSANAAVAASRRRPATKFIFMLYDYRQNLLCRCMADTTCNEVHAVENCADAPWPTARDGILAPAHSPWLVFRGSKTHHQKICAASEPTLCPNTFTTDGVILRPKISQMADGSTSLQKETVLD